MESNLSPTPSKHGRSTSTQIRRQALPRQMTKGPLGLEDPPDSDAPVDRSNTPLQEHSIISEALCASPVRSSIRKASPAPTASQTTSEILPPLRPTAAAQPPAKDFSFLLGPEIYHPLSDLELAPPYRSIPLPINADKSSPTATLSTLLATGRFHTAATLSAHFLTTSPPPPAHLIFPLFHTRLVTLLLLSHTSLAAEESKALQDLSNPCYLSHPPTAASPHPAHLVPWALRVLAVRLQALGYNDARRGIAGFHDLAREARGEFARADTSEAKKLWKERLAELGVAVGNALVEMGDLDGAARYLRTLKVDGDGAVGKMRLVLVYLRLGDIDAARRCFGTEGSLSSAIITALAATASSAHSPASAVEAWESALATAPSEPLLRANKAVSLVYANRITEARSMLEELVVEPQSVNAGVLFNLCTVFELMTERAREAKGALAERVGGRAAAGEGRSATEELRERGMGEFKL